MYKSKEKIVNKLAPEDLEAITNIMGGLLDKQSKDLVSKKDLEDAKVELRSEIKASEERIKEELGNDLKSYIHEGIDAVMGAIDDLSNEVTDLRAEIKYNPQKSSLVGSR